MSLLQYNVWISWRSESQPCRWEPRHPRPQQSSVIPSALDKGQVRVDPESEALSFAIGARKRGTWPGDVSPPGPNKEAPPIKETGSPRCNWPDTRGLNQGQPKDREQTAVCSPEGLFEFNVMPFGLCNASATFQRLMDCVLAGLHWQSCLVYLDDVIILGRSFSEHLHNLRNVFDRFQEAGLKLKPSKCTFGQKEVAFLGHIVSDQGVATDPAKVAAIANWSTPRSRKEVQQFLGLGKYYRRSIKDFATIAKPLHRLAEEDREFLWTESCEEAFWKLKGKLISAPILAFPDFTKSFVLDTDASNEGIGAVLSQVEAGKEIVIAYAS